ncbi:MAG: hypothetical protein ACTSX7_17740 [Alphaproteobacteria bacterium]
MGRFGRLTLLAALAVALAACASSGPVANPVARSLTWFNYAAGADIRAACGPNSPDRYRWVYNGIYGRQIRAYDLTFPSSGAELLAQARGVSGNLRQLSPSQPLGPWDLTRETRLVAPSDVNQLLAALAADRRSAPPAAGQRLVSTEFYWLVTACQGGDFSMAAFRHAKTPHQDLAFQPLLLGLDHTDVDFKAARRIEGQRGGDGEFQLHINASADGLVGPIPAF